MSWIKKITKKLLWLAAAVILLAGCAGADGSIKTMEAGNVREQSIEASGLEPGMSENTETVSPEAEVKDKTEKAVETERTEKAKETEKAEEAEEREQTGEEGEAEKTVEAEQPDEALGLKKTAGEDTGEAGAPEIDENGVYDTKEDVALYLHIYGHLPDNYITKKEAEKLGWRSKEGNLWDVAPGMSIGGSRFGNYERQLPEKEGRKYYECDLEYDGGYRGAKRLIYSDDGLIFYTEDHYKTFEQLYDGNEQ